MGLKTSNDSGMRLIVSCNFEDDSKRPTGSEKRPTADMGVDSNLQDLDWMGEDKAVSLGLGSDR